jgi:hypothetical protein
MTRVLLRKTFALEHVAQVPAAVGTLNLDPMAIGIGYALHGAWYLLIKARPTAAGVKLGIGPIELGIAAAADVRAVVERVFVLAGKRPLGAFELYDVSLLVGQLVVLHALIVILSRHSCKCFATACRES